MHFRNGLCILFISTISVAVGQAIFREMNRDVSSKDKIARNQFLDSTFKYVRRCKLCMNCYNRYWCISTATFPYQEKENRSPVSDATTSVDKETVFTGKSLIEMRKRYCKAIVTPNPRLNQNICPSHTPLPPFKTDLSPEENSEIFEEALVHWIQALSPPETKITSNSSIVDINSTRSGEGKTGPKSDGAVAGKYLIPIKAQLLERIQRYFLLGVKNIQTDCGHANCAVTVDVWTDPGIRQIVIKKALNKVKREIGFRSVFNPKSPNSHIVKKGCCRYVVTMMFKKKYLEGFP